MILSVYTSTFISRPQEIKKSFEAITMVRLNDRVLKTINRQLLDSVCGEKRSVWLKLCHMAFSILIPI